MLMEMAGSRSCGGRAFQDNWLDEEIAREPSFKTMSVKCEQQQNQTVIDCLQL